MAQGSEGKVLGIGGVFLRADDPATLAAWYRQMLGITMTEAGQPDPDGNYTWVQESGHTVMAMFSRSSDYFAADRTVMLNFRVAGLDALSARFAAAGVAVERRAEWDMPGVGRFARIHDPEGNPIELWEPDPGD
jgi:glyoxylase I family protein